MLEISIDRDTEKKLIQSLNGVKNGIPRALSQAVNRTIRRGKNTLIPKYVVEDTNLNVKKKRVKEATKYDLSNPSRLSGFIGVKGRRISAAQFSPKVKKKEGVSVQFFKPGQRQMFEGAFKGVFNSGNILIARRSKYDRYNRRFRQRFPYGALPPKYRFPVDVIYGPSIPGVMNLDRNIPKLIEKMDVELDKQIETAINSVLKGFAR